VRHQFGRSASAPKTTRAASTDPHGRSGIICRPSVDTWASGDEKSRSRAADRHVKLAT